MKNGLHIGDLSPLRYPGSKKKLVPYLHSILQHNEFHPNVLVEPFVGGGSVVLHFLKNRIVEKAIIADGDRLISSFWHVVFSNPTYLINFIRRVKIHLDNFYAYKAIAKRAEDYDELKLAEACIFLNRTSFSGILTDQAGPLGGIKQNSQYKITCRFNRARIVEKIRHMSVFKRKVIVLPYAWEDTIKYAERWTAKRKRLNRVLFYFDPPFYKKADDLYRKYFTGEEHEHLCERILSLKYKWILSYDNVPQIKRMYCRNVNVRMHVEMPYSINLDARRFEKELIITPLSLPRPIPR